MPESKESHTRQLDARLYILQLALVTRKNHHQQRTLAMAIHSQCLALVTHLSNTSFTRNPALVSSTTYSQLQLLVKLIYTFKSFIVAYDSQTQPCLPAIDSSACQLDIARHEIKLQMSVLTSPYYSHELTLAACQRISVEHTNYLQL